MSGAVIRIDDRLNRNELASQLALQCAPLLMGIKVSNILIVEKNEEDRVKQLFNGSMLSYHLLFKCKKRVVFLLFDKKEMLSLINGEEQKAFLYSQGYNDSPGYNDSNCYSNFSYSNVELVDLLETLSARYQSFMNTKEQFPHELGILLGYPVQDVKSFIEHEGKHFLYTGYWKVYHNLQDALATFESYNMAKKKVTRLVAKGFGIEKIIESYPNRVKANRVAV